MGGVSDGQLIPVGPFSGIDNVSGEQEAPASSLRRAENVDITNAGRARRRDGYALRYALSGARSAWSDPRLAFGLVAAGGSLYFFSDNESPRVVAPVAPLADISYAAINGQAYYSDGYALGTVNARGEVSAAWTPTPVSQPDVTLGALGPWRPGAYQLAITHVDQYGRESAASESTYFQIASPSTVTVVNAPIPEDPFAVTHVYMTEPDGATLYLRAVRPNGMDTFDVPFGQPGRALETQFLSPMPAGKYLAASNGRLYVAVHNQLWHSEPMRHGLTRPARNFTLFSGAIDGVAATGEAGRGSGVFVSVEGTIRWLDGADPASFQSMQVYGHGAVPGTMVRVPASYFNIEGLADTQMLAHWVATNGVLCLGLPGGTVMPYSERTVLADGSAGAATYIEREGIRQVINNLSGDATNNVRAVDRFSTRVFRNGVEI